MLGEELRGCSSVLVPLKRTSKWHVMVSHSLPHPVHRLEKEKAVPEEGPTNLCGYQSSPRSLKYKCPAVAANCSHLYVRQVKKLCEDGHANRSICFQGMHDVQHQHFKKICGILLGSSVHSVTNGFHYWRQVMGQKWTTQWHFHWPRVPKRRRKSTQASSLPGAPLGALFWVWSLWELRYTDLSCLSVQVPQFTYGSGWSRFLWRSYV